MKTPKSILIIGTVWPEPNSSAAGTRMLQLIALFQKQGWSLTFASAASDGEFMLYVTTLGIDNVAINLNDSKFDIFVKDLNPTMVLFDRFMVEEQFGWRVAKQCPDALRILDTEDLHCLRLARQKAFQQKKTFQLDAIFSDVAKREIASILRCDLSLIISEFEMDLLQKHFKIDKNLLYYLPFLVDEIDKTTVENWLSFEDRKDFIFIGNMLHEPNWNTVQYLKESVWPLIRKQLPEASMLIYGAYPSPKVNQLHQPKDGFLIKGRAESAQEVMLNAKVCLAPLRFGAGLKGKLIDAMECGTPSVTTSIGAEAMHAELDWGGIIADDIQEFANGAVSLYSDKTKWIDAQLKGSEIINQVFDKEFHSKLLIDKLEQLQKKLNQHRHRNFIGSMLMHHTISGTKYMSRWIEEKNKKPL